MLLYNVTLIIDDSVADAWLTWMLADHVPKVMSTGKFVSNRLLKVVDSPNEGVTYCAQYVAENMGDYVDYQENYGPAMQQDLAGKFGEKIVAFRTLMEFVD
jgi:hypothetical protein